MTPPTWPARAACRDEDPELFFPVGKEETAKALAVCRRCPVRAECLDDAIDAGHHGIWGGTDEGERRKLRVRRWAQMPSASAPEGSKACTTCGVPKPLTDFYTDHRATDGRQGRCKACHLAAVKDPALISDEEAAHHRAVLVDALKTPASTEGTR